MNLNYDRRSWITTACKVIVDANARYCEALDEKDRLEAVVDEDELDELELDMATDDLHEADAEFCTAIETLRTAFSDLDKPLPLQLNLSLDANEEGV